MEFNLHISRKLHEEHDATLGQWMRLEQALGARDAAWPPAPDSDAARALRDCAAGLAHEVTQHFAFEESALFPRLAEAGEGDIAELLGEEHVAIRAAAARFSELHAAGLAGTLDAAGWNELRTLAFELTERLVSHVQKEELSLLPALEDLIDEDTDRELITEYSQ